MGLFDFFKKKPLSHEDKVDAAYKCYKPDMVGMVYPGGKTQASNIIISIAKICRIDLSACDASRYYGILTIYSDALIRKVVTNSSSNQIISHIATKHGDLVTSRKMASEIVAFLTLNMSNNSFTIDSEESMSMVSLVASSLLEAEEAKAANTTAEKENLDDPEYGLVPNKPVYTKGVAGSKDYLAKLKTSTGEPLSWNRRGSTSVEGINGMIDIYDSTLPSGAAYKRVYVNMYGSSNSQKIPKGFSK